jgi:hypothetical protein
MVAAGLLAHFRGERPNYEVLVPLALVLLGIAGWPARRAPT